jgi:hypothetical protein
MPPIEMVEVSLPAGFRCGVSALPQLLQKRLLSGLA